MKTTPFLFKKKNKLQQDFNYLTQDIQNLKQKSHLSKEIKLQLNKIGYSYKDIDEFLNDFFIKSIN